MGNVTTVDQPVSKKTVPLPHKFADVTHINIGCGCTSRLDGIKYALFAVDRASRQKYIYYPMQSLKEDVLPSIHNLLTDIGQTLRKIIIYFLLQINEQSY